MFKAEIKKDGVLTNAASFETQEQCEAWVNENAQAFPVDFTVEYIDQTEAITYEADIAKNEKRIAFGNRLMAEFAARNKRRLIAGQTTAAEIFAAEEKLAVVQRRLQNSSTEKAYQDLLALTVEEIPAEEKAFMVAKIAGFLQAGG